MFTKLQLSIIVLLAILTMIYSFQQTEHFADSRPFKLKLTDINKYITFNGYFDANATGTSFKLGSKDSLLYNDKCLLCNDGSVFTTACDNKKGTIYFKSGSINCLDSSMGGSDMQLYLKKNYRFEKGGSTALKLERVYI